MLTDDGDCACNSADCLDHAVLMVGYDDTAEIPYFKIKVWTMGKRLESMAFPYEVYLILTFCDCVVLLHDCVRVELLGNQGTG